MWTRWGRRRHHEAEIFYVNTSKWRPSSGWHWWRLNWSFTRHLGSFKLPLGLGVEYFGRGVQRVRRGRRR